MIYIVEQEIEVDDDWAKRDDFMDTFKDYINYPPLKPDYIKKISDPFITVKPKLKNKK